jgi:hypothetical protein
MFHLVETAGAVLKTDGLEKAEPANVPENI